MVSINLRELYTPNVVSPKTASEIVFVADRSGSMDDCMEALKTAMKFFLKSLPNNCIFNICSFGSTVELMWPKSQPYNQETVDEALSYVANHFLADMGGTEIERAVRHVVERSEISVNTEIIILTDGEVWNDLSLFHFIEKTRSSLPNQNTRFFCLGIGEAVSHHLVAGIGRYGGGLAEVVATDSTGDWMQSVIGMLRAALTPSSWTVDVTLDGVSISENKNEDNRCIQAPHQIPDFHAFSRSSIYFLLNKNSKGKSSRSRPRPFIQERPSLQRFQSRNQIQGKSGCINWLQRLSWATSRVGEAGSMIGAKIPPTRRPRQRLMSWPRSKARK